jgi:hypothetical protein
MTNGMMERLYNRKWRELLGRYIFGMKETELPSLTGGALPPDTRRLSSRQYSFFHSPPNELLQLLNVSLRRSDQVFRVSLRQTDPVFRSGPVSEPMPNQGVTAMTQYSIPGDGLAIPLLPALRP